MDWVYLLLASLFEIGWPLGLKVSQAEGSRLAGLSLAALTMALSVGFLWLAQRSIPIGTAYAVWTGIGAVGAFILGILLFNDPASLGRYLGVALIVAGVITLKLAH